jgi:hypothetical protein
MPTLEGAVNMVAELSYENGPRLVIELIPWSDGSTVHADKALRLDTRANAATRARVERTLAEGTVVRASVGPMKEDDARWSASFKLPVRRTKGSPDLLAAIAERARPIIVRDPMLGRIKLDRKLGCFDGKLTLWGKRRKFSVEIGRDHDHDAAIADAKKSFAWIESSREKIEKALVAKLFKKYDEDWREERPRITKEQLLARIKVESVAAYGGGLAQLYLGAGTLFRGHGIDVKIRGLELSEINLAG